MAQGNYDPFNGGMRAFVEGQGGGCRAPASFYDVVQTTSPRPCPATSREQAPVSKAEPTLSVSSANYFTLSKALLLALELGAESRFRLVVPTKAGDGWFFDTNPRGEEGHRLPQRGRAQFRVPPIGRDRFLVPQRQQGEAGRVVTNRNTYAPLLHFRLGEEVEPGYYRLVRT